MSGAREPLSRDALTELIGAERITDSPSVHRERIRTEVFGLGGDAGRDRYDALAAAADQALAGAERERANHARAVDDAGRALGELRQAADDAAAALSAAREGLADAGLPTGGLPGEVRTIERSPAPAPALLRTSRHGDPEPIIRPAAALAEIIPADTGGAQQLAAAAAASAAERLTLAERRLAEARRLAQAQQQVLRVEADAEHLRAAADDDAQTAEEQAAERDAAGVALAQAWRAWTDDRETRELLGERDWSAPPTRSVPKPRTPS